MKKIYLIGTIIGLSIITMFTSLSVFATPISEVVSSDPEDTYIFYSRDWYGEDIYDNPSFEPKAVLNRKRYFDIQYNEVGFEVIYSSYQGVATTLFGLGVYDLYLGVYGLWDDLPMHKEFKVIDNGYRVFDLSLDSEVNAPNNSKWDTFEWQLILEYSTFDNKNGYESFVLSPAYINSLLNGVSKEDNQQPYIRFEFKDGYDMVYQQGYNQGFNDGLAETYQYDKGFNDGYQQGYDIGYNEALNIGQTMGYNQARDFYGYYDGAKWITAKTWGDLQFAKGQTENTNYFSIMFTGFFSFITALGGIELLPGLYIWHFVVFPLVFGIIFFIIGRSGGDNNKGGKK